MDVGSTAIVPVPSWLTKNLPLKGGLAPGPQAGGQYRAAADLLPRLSDGLVP